MSAAWDLTLEKVLRCRADAAFRCWSSPELLRRVLGSEEAPVVEAVLEPQAGGAILILRRVEGVVQLIIEGCFLHVVPGRRLVFTDMLTAGWRPRVGGSFTADLSFTPTDRGFCDFRIILRHAVERAPSRARLAQIEARWRDLSEQLGRLGAAL